ncbi:tyrosine-type recombinase/integrase [Salinisphaera sp.]|uniref:phage integrase n=1 Tax=Salinisphaera sp. TaxID=1914330 RepID=UPI000C55C2C1|nr:tyrosine-type recombinase/integrase [Salinisphaera sp.]MAS10321.1 hypothetical protein [Salinisphaera sp.]
MKAAINNSLLKQLPEGRDVDIYDTRLIGFALRVRKSGRHSYRVNYGRGKWATIGRLSDIKPAEAREQAQKILGDAVKGIDVGAARKQARASTLRDYLANIYGPWVKTHRKSGAATLSRLEACFDTDLGGKRLHEITPWLVEKWRSRRVKKGRAPATINRDITTLKASLNKAVEWGIIEANPIAKVKPAKLDRKGIVRYLSDDEEKRLREALAARDAKARIERENANHWRAKRGYPTMPVFERYSDHLTPMVLLALNTGMRRGELFALKWSNVDLERGALAIQGDGAKSGQTRHIPLNSEALDVLKHCPQNHTLVLPGKGGAKLTTIKKSWGALVESAKVENFRFHDLRHTFASKLVMRGVDLNTVRELLGHGDLTMTLRYAHLAPEHKAAAVEKLRQVEV